MAQASPECASSGPRFRGSPSGPRGTKDHPLMDSHLAALLGGADTDLLAAISILALSGMRLDEMRRLRVAQCGRGSFRVGECAANLGSREVPVHSALAGTVLRLTRGRAGDAFLIGDGAERAAGRRWAWPGRR